MYVHFQESYWRIPSSIRKRDVELRLETLEKILNLNEESEAASNESVEKAAEIGTDNETRPTPTNVVSSDSDSSDDESITNVRSQKRRRIAMDSSDDEGETVPQPSPSVVTNDDISLESDTENDSIAKPSSPSTKSIVDSGSDSEDEGNDFGVGVKKKRAFVIDSDSE